MAEKSGIARRDLLQVGAVTVAVPGFLAACASGRSNPGPEVGVPVASAHDFERFGVTKETIGKVMAVALSRGGDFADLYFEHSSDLSVGYEDGKVNRAQTSVGLGVGIRVVVGDQTGYAFTEELSLDAMTAAARTAAGIASLSPGQAPADLTSARYARHYDTEYDWRDVGVAAVKPLLESLGERAHALEPNLRRVQQRFLAGQKNIMVVDSDGRVSVDSQPMTRIYMTVVMEKDGETQSNSYNLAAREGMGFYTPERQERLVQVALDRTRILFDSGRPPAGELPVVLAAGSSGILLHEAIGHGMEADFNRKGISIFSDRLNKRVAIDDVTIIDDGTQANTRGAINFDDEGNPSQSTPLVEKGILR
ncbi:MAG: TldD/PmbA family protein, partial [Myxococcota bacterium]